MFHRFVVKFIILSWSPQEEPAQQQPEGPILADSEELEVAHLSYACGAVLWVCTLI